MNKIISYIKARLNKSTMVAIIIIMIMMVAGGEVIDTLRWFIKTELKVLLTDKEVIFSIVSFVAFLFHYKK